MSTQRTDLEIAYGEASSRALVTSHGPVEIIRANGADRLDLLHRLTTNNLVDLGHGSWRPTLLTNSLGRLIDRVLVLAHQTHAHLIPSPAHAPDVVEWLNSYIFFQDDVQLEIEPAPRSRWTILGPGAVDLLRHTLPGVGGLEQGEFANDQGSLVLRISEPIPGYDLYSPADSTVGQGLMADLPYTQLAAQQAYTALRIERALPAPGRELTADVIPLEIGLKAEIDFVKGCYIGQEVIARMESRGKAARALVRLELEGEVQLDSSIRADGKEVGKATSVAFSPEHGWIGLGLLSARALDRLPPRVQVGQPVREAAWQPVGDPRPA